MANRRRADLRHDKGLTHVTATSAPAAGSIVHDGKRFRIELKDPGRIVITVSERYTEDIIFEQFATEFQARYEAWLVDRMFRDAVANFRGSLERNGRCYVINMAKAMQHREGDDFERMENKNIIVPFEELRNLRQLKNALYQVRCNIFHGEKVPGDLNDDRITKAAVPTLRLLVTALTENVYLAAE